MIVFGFTSKKVSQRHWTIEKLAIWMRQTSWNVSGFFSGEEIATTTCTNCLGDLCRKSGWNIDVGNTEEKAYSCLFQHDGFRPTKTSEITPRLSFFHTLPWLLTHPQYINICEKPLSLWRNLGTSLKRNISMCKNARPLRGAHTKFDYHLQWKKHWNIETHLEQRQCLAHLGSQNLAH
jgi:hypothetical protein